MAKIMCSTSVYTAWKQGCSLEALVLVSRRLEDMKSGLGLEEKVLVLVLKKKSRYFQDLDEW